MSTTPRGGGSKGEFGAVTASYEFDQGGREIAVASGSGQWQYSNLYAGAASFATYDAAGTRFQLADALGSRARRPTPTEPSGSIASTIPSATGSVAPDRTRTPPSCTSPARKETPKPALPTATTTSGRVLRCRTGPVPHARLGRAPHGCALRGLRRSAVAEPVYLRAQRPCDSR